MPGLPGSSLSEVPGFCERNVFCAAQTFSAVSIALAAAQLLADPYDTVARIVKEHSWTYRGRSRCST